MNKLRNTIWLFVAIIFAVGLVILTLSGMVTNPAHVIPELGGDAIKNTFTYIYHSTLGSGYWFDGMNYPYGEHILYTDGQPVLSVLLASIGGITAEQALAVYWILLGLSYVLSIVYVYRILLHFKVPPFWAIVFAGVICICTPQILRLKGHYALAYPCVIPMIFYWTIRYHERSQWRYCFYFFVMGCIAAFLHPYYAALMLVWTTFYVLGYFFLVKDELVKKIEHSAWLFTSVILVLGVIGVVMKITDPIRDRPATPFYTLHETCTQAKHIVTSVYSPVWNTFEKSENYHMVSSGGEGYAYVGLVVILVGGISLLVTLIKSVQQKKLRVVGDQYGFSPVWLFTAFAALLFSMGIPFKWHMEWIMQYMSIFKQFRSLGRFSWIFYYVITIYAVVLLYHLSAGMKSWKKYVLGYSLLLLSLGLWGYEASGYVKFTRDLSLKAEYYYGVVYTPKEQGWEAFLNEHHFSGNDFQAILIIPYFHIGTEKLWVGDPDWKIMLSAKAALQLHLPVIDVMMSRSSWSQAMAQVKIDGGPFTDKPILRDIKSRKPFLLMHFEEDSLNVDQKYLLQASEPIGHFSQCHVYACYPDRLAANDKKYADSVAAILPFMKQGDTVINISATSFINHFDEKAGKHLFGTGGAPAEDKDSTELVTIPVASVVGKELYEFSCWFMLGNQDFRSPYITLHLLDEHGAVVTECDAVTNKSVDNHGMWFRCSKYFRIPANIRSVRCRLRNIPKPTYIAMDELVLRQADALIISKGRDGTVMVNNHFFKQK